MDELKNVRERQQMSDLIVCAPIVLLQVPLRNYFYQSPIADLAGRRPPSIQMFRCLQNGGGRAVYSSGPLRYFHSHTLATVLPSASTSYSKAPQALLIRSSFFDFVR